MIRAARRSGPSESREAWRIPRRSPSRPSAYGTRSARSEIDAEEHPELDPELWPLVLRPEEREGLKAWPAAERGRLALIVFSSKESLYKAQYPRSGQFMEFFDVHVEVVRTGGMIATVGEMVCRFRRDVGPFGVGAAFRGRFRELGADAGILTGVQIPATPHAHPVASG